MGNLSDNHVLSQMLTYITIISAWFLGPVRPYKGSDSGPWDSGFGDYSLRLLDFVFKVR